MSQSRKLMEAGSSTLAENGKGRATKSEPLRFTPLRSHITRAQALSRDASGDVTLSRLVPVPLLQS